MNYRQEMLRTANLPNNQINLGHEASGLLMGAVGLAGETGEVIDLIKKHCFHSQKLDKEKLIKELGDVRWYFEYLLAATGITMEEVEQKNIEKLRKRYPNGFSPEAAKNRVDLKEQK